MLEKFCGFAFDKHEDNFLSIYIGTQNSTYKISREIFVVCRKSAKTTKVFLSVGFLVYDACYIILCPCLVLSDCSNRVFM